MSNLNTVDIPDVIIGNDLDHITETYVGSSILNGDHRDVIITIKSNCVSSDLIGSIRSSLLSSGKELIGVKVIGTVDDVIVNIKQVPDRYIRIAAIVDYPKLMRGTAIDELNEMVDSIWLINDRDNTNAITYKEAKKLCEYKIHVVTNLLYCTPGFHHREPGLYGLFLDSNRTRMFYTIPPGESWITLESMLDENGFIKSECITYATLMASCGDRCLQDSDGRSGTGNLEAYVSLIKDRIRRGHAF